jgi:predicted nucleic acid-binding Zn ribbon protein
MPSRREPRRIGEALAAVQRRAAPQTPLAAVQMVWAEVVGERVAGVAEPVAERAGRVTVACSSAVWAQELDLMQADILRRLGEAMDTPPTALKFEPRGS